MARIRWKDRARELLPMVEQIREVVKDYPPAVMMTVVSYSRDIGASVSLTVSSKRDDFLDGKVGAVSYTVQRTRAFENPEFDPPPADRHSRRRDWERMASRLSPIASQLETWLNGASERFHSASVAVDMMQPWIIFFVLDLPRRQLSGEIGDVSYLLIDA